MTTVERCYNEVNLKIGLSFLSISVCMLIRDTGYNKGIFVTDTTTLQQRSSVGKYTKELGFKLCTRHTCTITFKIILAQVGYSEVSSMPCLFFPSHWLKLQLLKRRSEDSTHNVMVTFFFSPKKRNASQTLICTDCPAQLLFFCADSVRLRRLLANGRPSRPADTETGAALFLAVVKRF